jgi:hypothetical protein
MRWIIIALLVVTLIRAYLNRSNSEFGVQYKLGLFSMIALHTQLLIGVALLLNGHWGEYTVEGLKRFIMMEHTSMMIIAVVLGTLGHSLSKRAEDVATKYRRQFIFFGLSFVIIMAMIPWPCLRNFGEVYNWL